MFTDIVGYTALMGSDEDKAFKTLRKNRDIQRPIIKKYRGEWLKEMGDGILSSFHTASDAVRCAGEIQHAAKKAGIPLRIGIHEGEVVFEGGDVLGDGVNVASRLEELAEEGSINISGAVYKDIKNKAGIEAEFIEEKILKNVEEPVKVYQVHFEEPVQEVLEEKKSKKRKNKIPYYLLAGSLIIIAFILIWYNQRKQLDIEIEKSIAVLPLINDSPDQENEYFCNGMMDDILNHLAKISDLQVLSRTDVEPYRGSSKTRKDIANELGVANLLEGSVRKQGNRFKITLQLINAESGFHLWSNTYEGEYTEEIFTVQSNIAQQVASALKAVITPQEAKMIGEVPTTDISAYDLVQRGYYFLGRYMRTISIDTLHIAIDYFRNAITVDSNYAQAYGGLSSLYFNAFNYDSMYFYADRAIKLNPLYTQGYYYRGTYFWAIGKADSAITDLIKAIDMSNGNHRWARLTLGCTYCMWKNDFGQGIYHINKAITECQREFEKGVMSLWLSIVLMNAGDYEKAENYILHAIKSEVGCFATLLESFLLILQGQYKKAIQFTDSMCQESCRNICSWSLFNIYFNLEEYVKAELYYYQWDEEAFIYPQFKNWTKINWAYVCQQLGRFDEANRLFDEIINESEQLLDKGYYWTFLDLSRIYAFKNNKEKSLKYLRNNENFVFQWGIHDYILIDPLFKNLRDDPDFLEIVNQLQAKKAELRKQINQLKEEGVL
jgi:TolB-like protein